MAEKENKRKEYCCKKKVGWGLTVQPTSDAAAAHHPATEVFVRDRWMDGLIAVSYIHIVS